MEPSAKPFRRLLFVLGDVEQLLRSAGRMIAADALAKLVNQVSAMPVDDFIIESRVALENALLGERGLPEDLIGVILDALEKVDELLRTQMPQ